MEIKRINQTDVNKLLPKRRDISHKGDVSMSACTFFGHRECPDSIKAQLRAELIDLVINHDVDMFYVGNQGRFDAIVRSVLREMKKDIPRSITP